MKPLYFIVALLTFMYISNNASAQLRPSYGVRAGLLVSDWRGDAVESLGSVIELTNGMAATNPRTGFYAGGYLQVPVGNLVSIEPGIYYSQKGYTINGDFSIKSLEFLGADARAQVQSGYIDIPLLVKVEPVKGLQLFAGPQLSYLAHSDLHLDAGVLGISIFRRDIDISGNMNRWDVGMTGGIAYQFANGINIQAGYEHGLSRLDAGSRFKSYNQAVRLGVGFSF